jgi:hypothetical protein
MYAAESSTEKTRFRENTKTQKLGAVAREVGRAVTLGKKKPTLCVDGF